MLPENRPSTITHFAPWREIVRGPLDYLVDYEVAGDALFDGTKGMRVRQWYCRAIAERDGLGNIAQSHVQVRASGKGWETILTRPGTEIVEVCIAFDNNMAPFVGFVESDGRAYRWWFDSLVSDMVLTELPSGTKSVRACIDEKDPLLQAVSDICFFYIRGGALYASYQRERYQQEHEIISGLGDKAELCAVQVNLLYRVQWQIKESLPIAGTQVSRSPLLADVVADLLRRSDVPAEHIDVRHLYQYTVDGYRIANEGGADSNIEPLTHAWFFDPAEWDKKLRFIPRGQEPVAHLTFDDLIEQNGNDGPLEMERVQEVELLRKVNVTMVDSTAGWVTNKQTAERRSATIRAVGEQSVVLPITAHPDFAATVAAKRLRVPWGEPHKLRFGLGTPWTALTPTDVVTLEDRRGRVHQIRLGQIEEDYGSFSFETTTNANWVYEVQAQGVSPRPPIPTVPGRAGDTVVIPMDLPVLRDQDDELGYYVAVYGTGNGWGGGLVQISLDGGATVAQSIDVTVPSVAGTVLSTLLPERGSEYLSHQTLTVSLPLQPESITHEAILRYGNLAAVQHTDGTWEVLQFETVTVLGDGEYELSGLVRGRYATTPGAVDPDSPFVLLDASVMFVQMQQWMIGETVSYRGVTYNQNPDDVEWQSFAIDHPQSQTEWPVYDVRRDGDAVSWIGRARLGVEVAPHHSKYFGGYRVTYSDGHTADTMNQQYTRAGTPPGATVTVQAINTITGVGP